MPKKTLAEHIGPAKSLMLIGPLLKTAPQWAEEQALICVDGGCRWHQGSALRIGDGDSWDGELDIRLQPEKDLSDLAFVLQSLPDHLQELQLLGFLGGRRDHELFNLGEAHRFLKQRPGCRLSFDQSVLGFSAGEWSVPRQGHFSAASFEDIRIRLSGDIQYPHDGILPFASSRGLSNRCDGEIHLRCEGPVFLFLPSLDQL